MPLRPLPNGIAGHGAPSADHIVLNPASPVPFRGVGRLAGRGRGQNAVASLPQARLEGDAAARYEIIGVADRLRADPPRIFGNVAQEGM
jgi:hypothetical protein